MIGAFICGEVAPVPYLPETSFFYNLIPDNNGVVLRSNFWSNFMYRVLWDSSDIIDCQFNIFLVFNGILRFMSQLIRNL